MLIFVPLSTHTCLLAGWLVECLLIIQVYYYYYYYYWRSIFISRTLTMFEQKQSRKQTENKIYENKLKSWMNEMNEIRSMKTMKEFLVVPNKQSKKKNENFALFFVFSSIVKVKREEKKNDPKLLILIPLSSSFNVSHNHHYHYR